MSDHTVEEIQSNSVRTKLPEDYAKHVHDGQAKYKRVMNLPFPNGAARDSYWARHKALIDGTVAATITLAAVAFYIIVCNGAW